MRIISPSYEILSEINGIDWLKQIERIARVCYKSEDKISPDGESAKRLVSNLIERKHDAMLEHISFSVLFTVDRGVSHELVRHRLASFAQESTRYCNYSQDKFGNELTFIYPHGLQEGSQAHIWWLRAMGSAERSYFKMINDGVSPQIARGVLPTATKADIVVTANLREWRHIFTLRTAHAAHPQMREVIIPLYKHLRQKVPVIFEGIGADWKEDIAE